MNKEKVDYIMEIQVKQITSFMLWIQDFFQWRHDKFPLPHQWMRNPKVGFIDMEVVIKKNIYVDDTIMVFPMNRLSYPSHLLLYALSCLQELPRCQGSKN